MGGVKVDSTDITIIAIIALTVIAAILIGHPVK
jgi:hypothetical protein